MVLGLMYPSFEEALLAARARSSVIQDTYTAVHRPRRRSQDRHLRQAHQKGISIWRSCRHHKAQHEKAVLHFRRALKVMADVYASAVATTTLQLKDVPPCPKKFDAALCFFGVEADGVQRLRTAMAEFGSIVSCQHTDNRVVLSFAQRSSAIAAKQAPASSLYSGVDFLYNERAYDARGWPTFEGAVSIELVARLSLYPKLRAALDS